ncbi:MAG: PilZ domain-containing protein [Vicinamibacteria bacterium]|nr:PilZ domain-containing protein [Vicinamibacteria bacterium]
MSSEYSKKRRFPRIPSCNAVLVNRLGDAPAEELGRTLVMGLGGCMFTSNESFGLGAHLQLLITVNREVVKSHARVVWERGIENGRVEIGVEFTALDDDARAKLGRLFGQSTSA